MKQIIKKIFCDDCGKEIPANKPCTTIEIIKHQSQLGDTIGVMMDFCWECLTWRVNHSVSIISRRICPQCNGSGTIHILYHNNSTEPTQCSKCKGEGII